MDSPPYRHEEAQALLGLRMIGNRKPSVRDVQGAGGTAGRVRNRHGNSVEMWGRGCAQRWEEWCSTGGVTNECKPVRDSQQGMPFFPPSDPRHVPIQPHKAIRNDLDRFSSLHCQPDCSPSLRRSKSTMKSSSNSPARRGQSVDARAGKEKGGWQSTAHFPSIHDCPHPQCQRLAKGNASAEEQSVGTVGGGRGDSRSVTHSSCPYPHHCPNPVCKRTLTHRIGLTKTFSQEEQGANAHHLHSHCPHPQCQRTVRDDLGKPSSREAGESVGPRGQGGGNQRKLSTALSTASRSFSSGERLLLGVVSPLERAVGVKSVSRSTMSQLSAGIADAEKSRRVRRYAVPPPWLDGYCSPFGKQYVRAISKFTVLNILCFLDSKDLGGSVSLVSKTWCKLAMDEAIWEG